MIYVEMNAIAYKSKYTDKVMLTAREQEILSLLSFGCTNREISDRLYVSTETIKTQRSSLMRKLKASNAAMLVRRGFEFNFLVAE